MRRERASALVGLALFALGPWLASAADRLAADTFEAKVRPLLVEHCTHCHGPDKQKGGLRLDSAEALARGGESGPAVVPGRPDESRLVEAVRYAGDLKMPPKSKLSEADVAALVAWVRRGAVWPAAAAAAGTSKTAKAGRRALVTDEDRDYWAFRPVRDPVPPAVRDESWPASPLDRFILAALEAAGLRPAPQADRRTLIRRLTFDLTGLPPTPEEVAAFLADDRPDAYERLVDRLLAGPAYGERWGRHWLDLARFADSNGMDENVAYANAWRYRDYVVSSFNADKPYDRFLREQLAGDLIPTEDGPARRDALTATGFLVIGPKMLAEDDPVKMEMDIIDEQVSTVGRVFLGLTLGCARCHDHKFDPIPTRDYYGLAGIFKSTRSMANHKVVAMWNERPAGSPEQRAALEAYKERKAAADGALKGARAEARRALRKEVRGRVADYLLAARVMVDSGRPAKDAAGDVGLQPELLARWAAALAKARDDPASPFRAWLERGGPELAAEYQKNFDRAAEGPVAGNPLAPFRRVLDDPDGPLSVPKGDARAFYPAASAGALAAAEAAVKELEASAPAVPEVMAVEEGEPGDLKIHIRGSHLALGETAPRGFLRVLAASDGDATPTLPAGSSGRRELADRLARPDHPLTARVMANRVWLGHFGRGIVRSPDNFGRLGEAPTHPELLDWLASRFVGSGWSVKALHRRIVNSATYRMSTRHDPAADAADPENLLRWRFDRRRLEAEEVRDAVLAVGGGLDRAMGGTRLEVQNHAYVNSTGAARGGRLYDVGIRSVYLPVIRSGLYPVFQAFDFADPSTSTGLRVPTTVPSQALFFLNDGLVLKASASWASRLLARSDLDDAGRVRLLYESAYGRPPTAAEAGRALGYLGRFESLLGRRGDPAVERPVAAWATLAQAILASSEFITVD